jgi:hypothetical protein
MKKICVVLLASCLSSLALAADVVVIESTSADYPVGEILDADMNIVLGEDVEIMLIAEDGMIISLAGPYTGPADNEGTPGVRGALDALGRLVGYAETEAGDIGGVRGDASGEDFLAQEVEDHRTSPWLLHTAITGPQCVRAGDDDPGYWREQNDADERLEVKHVTSGESVIIAWQAGDNTIAWPGTLPLLADEMYLLRFGDQLRSTNLLVREVPATVSDGGIAMVAFLAANGCLSQARKELERIQEERQKNAS